ncbi:class I adenylate-forming enzyme family protein [Ureibacillus sp. GCM10028918]|uniref:class I adenylate-forming enzyme family protein n=1 Tax=Ureibacillus sp. GCM10028918 TaxID=3273429 RepID=UPI003609D387
MNIYENILEILDRDIVSLTTLDNSLTAGNLQDAVSKYEGMLTPLNIKGKRIALLVPPIQEFLPLFLAINKLDGTVAPLSWQFRTEDLKNVINFLDPHIVFTITEHNGFSFSDIIMSWAKEINSEALVFTSDNCVDWKAEKFNGHSKQLEENIGGFICFTSGSTGTPKGMVFKNTVMDYSYNQLTKAMNLKSNDNTFIYASTSTVLGIVSMSTVLKGKANLIVSNEFDLVKIINLMKESECNKVLTTPSIFKAIYNFASKLNPEMLKKIELVCFVGEKIPDYFVKSFPLMEDCKFISHFGSSETGAIGNVFLENDSIELEYTLIDKVEAKSVDDELYVKTGAMFTEYLNNSILTKEVYENGWYKTGDLVEFLNDNVFKIVGRKKDIIKKGGQQVVSSEVEQIISRIEGVQGVAVVGAPHSVFGEQIVAFVVADELTSADIRTYCTKKISSYKIPDKIIFLDELPLNQVKVDKLKLKAQLIGDLNGKDTERKE